MDKVGKLITKSMTILDSTNENRFFEGYLTVEMKDKQGEITMVDELYKVLPIWMDRGAPITDTHSNRVIGKGINFAKSSVESEGVTYPAIKITGKIHKNYELDTDIWDKIRTGEYRGLSFGGATKADRTPKVMKDGDIAYALTDLEHYEVAVCKDPAVPLAIITDYNPLAKATVPSEPRGDGKEVIKCDKFGCYVDKAYKVFDDKDVKFQRGKVADSILDEGLVTDKDVEWFKSQNQGEGVKYPNSKRPDSKTRTHHRVGGSETPWIKNPNSKRPDRANDSGDKVEKGGEDWSNADGTTPATVTNTVSQSTQTAKPVKIDTKVGEIKDGIKTEVTPLEGGLKKEGSSTATSGTGGGVRAHPQDAYNQDDGEKQTSQNSTKIEIINQSIKHNEDVNKVLGALAAGALSSGAGAAAETGKFIADEVEENVKPLEPKEASAYETTDADMTLGGQAVPKEKKECSECGQSFNTEGEDYEKQVSAHKKHHKDSQNRASHNVSDADVTFVDHNEGKKVTWTTRKSDNIVNEFLDMLQTKGKKELKQRKDGNWISEEEQNIGKAKVKRGRRVYPDEGRHGEGGQQAIDNPENFGEKKTGLYGQKVKTWEVFLENKGAREKIRNLVTAPDVYPSEIKGISESTSDEDEKLKAWEFFLEKKHEWDHLSKDPEEDEKIKEEIDDSGNN